MAASPPLPDYLHWITGPLVEALEGVHIGLCIMTDDGARHRIVYSSVYNAALTGHVPEELIGTDSFTLVAPEEIPKLAARRERARQGEPMPKVMETRLVHKDGRRIPIEIGTTRVAFEGRDVIIAFNRDIRERKAAEEALGRSEQRFRRLIEAAPQAICALRDGEFIYVNPALVRVFGAGTAAEIVGRPVDDFFLEVVPETLPPHQHDRPPQQYRVRRPDGALVTLEVDLIAADFEGAPAVLGFARDVTERNRLQEQLLQADRMATVGLLAAGVAHEINNPLAYVALILDDLGRHLPRLRDEPERSDERIAGLLDLVAEARSGTERVGVIIRDLRTFSRAAADPSGIADVARVLESAVKIAQNDIRHRARLLVEVEAGLPPVAASEARLGQVFLNLLVNAVQAIPEGAPERHEIRIVADRRAGRVRVAVSDTGSGIPTEDLARIFDPFFSTKDPGVGTGLGLSVCKSIVAALGGDIQVKSQVGAGTTFEVTLPTAEAAPAEPALVAAAAEPPSERRVRILVVDDEPLLAKALARELAEEHDVTVANGGRRALELILAEDFDLVLCDVMMPDLSGLELFDELRQRRPGIERKLAFMTGGMFTPRAQAFLDRIDNPRVDKPFDMDEVRELIRAATGED
jgi:two-component system cell cycle sensor histidine kinase/response regulator CckA